jgi:cytochrome c oxidase assembly protein subunit 15
MLGVVHLVSLQVILGISTLIYLVPVPLAAAHQAGSLALLTGVLVLGNRIWVPKSSWRLVQLRLKQLRQGPSTTPARRGIGEQAAAMKEDLKAVGRNTPVAITAA